MSMPNHLLRGLKKNQVSCNQQRRSRVLWALLEGCEVESVLVVSGEYSFISVRGFLVKSEGRVSIKIMSSGHHLFSGSRGFKTSE